MSTTSEIRTAIHEGRGVPCDTCAKDTAGTAAAEVTRRGHHVLVHADCVRDDDEEAA